VGHSVKFYVFLCGWETWYVAVKEECRLRVTGNRVQIRIFAPKREDVAAGWRKLCNGELCNLYSSPM
jgi:hypothetical protein